MIDVCQFIDVVLLDGELERRGEKQDGVVNQRWARVVLIGEVGA